MEKFSPLKTAARLDITISLPPYLQDHRFMGEAVYPAVEAMQILANTAASIDPKVDVTRIESVRFDKFLAVPEKKGAISALVEVDTPQFAGLDVTLMTRKRLQSSSMSRLMTHARLSFFADDDDKPELPSRVKADLTGSCHPISPQRIYRELVPFGPAYRNLHDRLVISTAGAAAKIKAPDLKTLGPLGSPFPLDAAFHAACVWGQRYAGVVAFPVGIRRRIVVRPTNPGKTYHARIVPVQTTSERLMVDIWLYDGHGRLREMAAGVDMRDVSQGRLKPPEWIRK